MPCRWGKAGNGAAAPRGEGAVAGVQVGTIVERGPGGPLGTADEVNKATPVQDSVPPAWIRPPVVGIPPLPTAVIHPDRLFAVVESGLLDTAPETRFDDLVDLARDVAGGERGFFTGGGRAPLVLEERGGTDRGAGRETRVEDSVCQIMIATGAPLVVDDARHDVRTRGLGTVRELGIGAVVGHPVRDGTGQVIGGLCVSSAAPRAWTCTHSTRWPRWPAR